jgi:hypothetical protein
MSPFDLRTESDAFSETSTLFRILGDRQSLKTQQFRDKQFLGSIKHGPFLARFEALITVTMKNNAFWVVVPCSLVVLLSIWANINFLKRFLRGVDIISFSFVVLQTVAHLRKCPQQSGNSDEWRRRSGEPLSSRHPILSQPRECALQPGTSVPVSVCFFSQAF